MPSISGPVTSYDITGKIRDLSHIVHACDVTDTPFLSVCQKVEAKQTLHEWTTDELNPPADNAHIEGDDTTVFEGSCAREMNNKTQIIKRAVQVSGTGQVIEQAGVNEQYARQTARRALEVKKDLEFALLANQIESGGSKSAARHMRGAPCFITKNVNLGAGGAVADAANPATAGAQRVLTEDMLKDVLRQCYESGGNVKMIMAAPAVRSHISSMLRGGINRSDNIEKTKVTAMVDVYISDYGNVEIVPNRVQAEVPYTKNAALLIDPHYWAVAYLRNIRSEELAKTGDSRKAQIICEATLEARQPDSSGMISDITAA